MKFRCPHCGFVQKLPDKYAGRPVVCPGCNELFTIPPSSRKRTIIALIVALVVIFNIWAGFTVYASLDSSQKRDLWDFVDALLPALFFVMLACFMLWIPIKILRWIFRVDEIADALKNRRPPP